MKALLICTMLILPALLSGIYVTQPGTAKGKVTDQYGQPLVGVTVMVKGTSSGTITDLNGNFSLSIPTGAEIIHFSFVGMRTLELFIEGRTVFNIEMEEDRIGIDEVIAIGYGTMKKSDLTGSVSSIKGDDLQTGAVNSLDKQLSGRISGVQVTQTSGQPGSGTTIRIRGTNSIIANNEPLFVVDGVPYGYSIDAGVNPNDIESVEILKDASATAIYGSRGANGVVLITTKSGSQGKTKVVFDSHYTLSSVTNKLDLLNAEGIAEVHRMAIQQGVAQAYDPNAIQGAGTNWQDEMYRTAASKNYHMTVAGGSPNLSYYFSGNYLDEQGVVLNTRFERYGLRANINSKVNERLNLGLNLYMSRSIQNPVNEGKHGSGVITSILVGNPIYPVKDEAGRYTLFTDPSSRTGNPVAMALLETRENNRNTILTNLFGEYTVFDGLVARASFGSNIWDSKNNLFAPADVFTGIENNNQANINISNIFYWVSTNTLTYNKMINNNHNLEVMAGFTAEKRRDENVGVNSSNYITGYQLYHSVQSAENISATSSLNENQLASGIGRINYNLYDKYLITVSGRYDGSSVFGSENRWAFFPSAGIAWKISSEEFMQNLDAVVSGLKLRASVGSSGEQAIPSYRTLSSLATTSVLFANNTYTIGFIPDRLANPYLKWERTTQYNVGIDARFLNGRVNLTTDLYYKETKDLLYNLAIPSSTGYASVLSNVGSIENKGLEFNIRSFNTTGELKWTTDFNIAFNRNKVLDLGTKPDGTPITQIINPEGAESGYGSLQTQSALILGKPIGGAFGYIYDGTYKSVEEIANSLEPGKIPGDPKYRNANGDNVLDADDRVLISNPNPDFIGGINNSFSFKGWDFNFFLQFVVGHELFNHNHRKLAIIDGYNNSFTWALDAWSPENSESDIPRAGWDAYSMGISTFHVEDASFLRAKNITLGYTLPLKTKSISSIRLYCSVDNLFTLTDYTGYNPDISAYGGNSVSGGFDDSVYPLSRNVLFGLKVEF